MKRRFHWSLFVGFFLVLAGMVSVPFFAQFPATRDFAWVNLLFLVMGVTLLATALTQAIRQPQLFRGKIVGGILTAISVLTLGFFCVGIFYFGRVPQPETTQKAGEKAPELSLRDESDKTVTLPDLLAPQTGQTSPAKGALLIFYRGHW